MTKRDVAASKSWDSNYPANQKLHRLLQRDVENVEAGYVEGYIVAKEESAAAIRSRELGELEALCALDEMRATVKDVAKTMRRHLMPHWKDEIEELEKLVKNS